MSNLSDLLPAGAGGKQVDFVASGNLSNGQTVALKTNGQVEAVGPTTTSPSVTSATTYSTPSMNGVEGVAWAYDLVRKHFVLAYGAYNNNYYLTVVVATSNTSGALTFGTPVVYSSAIGGVGVGTNDGEVVGLFKREDGYGYFFKFGCEVTGTSISTIAASSTATAGGYGVISDVVYVGYDPSTDKYVGMAKDSSSGQPFVVGMAANFDPANAPDMGTPINLTSYGANNAQSLQAVYDPDNQKMVAFGGYDTGGGRNYRARAVTFGAGSSLTITLGTELDISSQTVKDLADVTYDESLNKFICAYRSYSPSETLWLAVVSLSGTSLSVGTPVQVTAFGTEERTVILYDKLAGATFVTYLRSGSYPFTVAIVNVSGTTPSLGLSSTSTQTNLQAIVYKYKGYDVENNISFVNGLISQQLRTLVINTGITQNFNNFIGITDAAISSGASGSVTIKGGISSNVSSLTPNSNYYVQTDGTLSTTTSTELAGRALSSTSINLDYTT